MNTQGTVSIRLRPNEKDTLIAAAAGAEVTVSEFMRRAALEVARRDEIAELHRRPGTQIYETAAGALVALWVSRCPRSRNTNTFNPIFTPLR